MWLRPPRSPTIVASALATIVWWSAASNITTNSPQKISASGWRERASGAGVSATAMLIAHLAAASVHDPTTRRRSAGRRTSVRRATADAPQAAGRASVRLLAGRSADRRGAPAHRLVALAEPAPGRLV